jgi:hypothetical protein
MEICSAILEIIQDTSALEITFETSAQNESLIFHTIIFLNPETDNVGEKKT